MFGRGTTGGVINTVSKAPALRNFASVDGYVGSGDFYRGLIDINRQVGATSAVRVNLMGTRAGVRGRDLVYSHRWGAAVTAGFGLGTNRTFTVTYLHQEDRRRPDYGIVVGQRSGQTLALPLSELGLDRSTFTGYETDRDTTRADILTARFRAAVNPWLTLTSDSRVGAYYRYFQYTTADGCFVDPVTRKTCADALVDGDPATVPIATIGGHGPYRMRAWGAQNVSTARIEAPVAGFRSQFILGTDVSYQANDKIFWVYALPPTIPGGYLPPAPIARNKIPVFLLNPIHTPPPGYAPIPVTPANLVCPVGVSVCTSANANTVASTDGDALDVAAFITERLWLSERFSLIGSLRVDRYEADFSSVAPNLAITRIEANSTLYSPRVSAVFEPSDSSTWYVTWGRSETPQGTSIVGSATALATATGDLAPEVSTALEAGAKVGALDGRLVLTASVFQVKKSNAVQTDPGTGFLVAQSGERQEVRGIELGLTGDLKPNWSISANYAYLDAEIKESFVNCVVPGSTSGTPANVVCPVGVAAPIPVLNTVAVGRQVVFTPRHSASLFTSYEFTDGLAGLSIGGDVAYQSKVNLAYTPVSASFSDRGTLVASRLPEAPENLTFNAFAAYRWDRYRIAVNVYNLADRLNYAQVFGNRAVPSPRRTVVLSLGAAF
jgi:catecholate siderophore receptor